MKNKHIESLLIVVVLQVLLLFYAWCAPLLHFSLFGKAVHLKFPAFSELADINNDAEKAVTKKVDSAIIKFTREAADTTLFLKKDTINQKLVDSLHMADVYFYNDTAGGSSPLDKFFEALYDSSSTRVVRVLHYGDSQIEGDRMTTYIRKSLMNEFGGSGIGFVPMTDVATHESLTRKWSSNWIRHTVFHEKAKTNLYSYHGTLFRFDDIDPSTLDSTKIPKARETATYTLKLEKWLSYRDIYLCYGQVITPCIITATDEKKKLLFTDTLQPSNGFMRYKLPVDAGQRNISFTFTSAVSPDFYGWMIEGDSHGVQVDNLGIRGHSGDGLLNINVPFYRSQVKQLGVRLIIVEYGANTVPYISSDKECKYVGEAFYNILLRLKTVAPEASILVVSTGDVAVSKDGKDSSPEFLRQYVDAQKEAAKKAGCAFFNLLDAMGGESSIQEWSEEKLASKDGHFSPSGQKLVATKIFNAINTEYALYKIRKGRK